MRDRNDMQKRIGERLRLARERAGLSQGQVAKMLGLHRPSVTELESGRRKLSAVELGQLARIYSVDTDWLSCAKDVNDPPDSDRLQIAAREMAKLEQEDFDLVIDFLKSLRKRAGKRG